MQPKNQRGIAWICVLGLIGLLAACSPAAPLAATPSVEPSATRTLRPTRTPSPTLPSPTPTATVPSPTPSITPVEPVQMQTPLPQPQTVISAENASLLQRVAVWGHGSIADLYFTPDGSRFLVGSHTGIAIYQRDHLDAPYRWIQFPEPVYYSEMVLGEDGDTLLFKDSAPTVFVSISRGQVISRPDGFRELPDVDSPIRLDAKFGDDPELENYWGPTGPVSIILPRPYIRDIYTNEPDAFLYSLSDPIYSIFSDEPAACETSHMLGCGNSVNAGGMVAKQFEVSEDGSVFGIFYAPDGHQRETRSNLLRIYNAQDGSLVMQFGNSTMIPVDFSFSPDSRHLLVGFQNGVFQIWDIASRKLLFSERSFSQMVENISVSADGAYYLISGAGTVEIRRIQDGGLVAGYEGTVAAFSPNGLNVAIGTESGEILLRDVQSSEGVWRIQGHSDEVYSLTFTEDGRYLITSGQDCDIKVWDVQTGEFLHFFEEVWTSINVDEEGRIFIYKTWDLPERNQLMGIGSWGILASWNLTSGALQYMVKPEYPNSEAYILPAEKLAWLYLNMKQSENTFHVVDTAYDLSTGEAFGVAETVTSVPDGCREEGLVSPDGTLIFSSGTRQYNGDLCILDAGDYHLVDRIHIIHSNGVDNRAISGLWFTPDGTRLIIATYPGEVMVYEVLE